MQSDYWPWWVGGPLLALVAVAFPVLTGSTLGVSGALGRWVKPRPVRAGLTTGKGAGAGCLAPVGETVVLSAGGGMAPWTRGVLGPKSRRGLGRGANLAFLVSIGLGGGLASIFSGPDWGSVSGSSELQRMFGSGGAAGTLLMLFGGGVLVGFGSRVSGGCTSGHGLSGCGRRRAASWVATVVFFGVAILVSFLMEAVRA